jgi:polyprenyl-phospho-N-acetylgalactosaminyl synthase
MWASESQPTAPRICFVVPAYNEASCVGDVIRRIRERYPSVVLVDDGSSDTTGPEAAAAGAMVIKHLLNRGQGAALKTGIDFALANGAEVIVTFDSDGQHRLEDVEALLAPVLAGDCDVALGSRFLRPDSQVPFARKLTLKLGVLFTRIISGIRVTDTHNGLRALSRRAAEQLQIRQDRMAHASEILDEIARLKLRYVEVPTRILYTDYSRQKGQRSSAALRIVWDFLIGRSSN